MPGAHILAVLGLNQTSSSSDFIQVPNLSLVTNPPAPSCLSGLLTTDTTLQAGHSPFLICGNLTVGNAITLTVEPGAVVHVAAGVDITVENGGRILAEGVETNRIQVTHAPGAGAWGGITVLGGTNSPLTRFAYTDFEGNGDICIEVNEGTVHLDHVTFGTRTEPYLSLNGSSFLISHCYFPSSTAAFELIHGTGGIKADGYGIVRDCYFGSTSGYNDIIDFTGGNRPDEAIVQFYNNVFSGATDDILDLDGTDAWVEGNIFLHSHKNGAPDSSAAVSGGNRGAATSEITIVRNLFFDCDQAVTAKQGNFYTLLNNTIVHTTKAGGLDTDAGVIAVRDLDPTPTTFGAGCYLEANIVVDAERLVRNYDPQSTSVTFVNNILPSAWDGPGTNNLVTDPLLQHVPTLAETQFTNWTDAQVLWQWFSLRPDSPALRTGPQGRDQGGVIPPGAFVSGEPPEFTSETTATLRVGVNRREGIPAGSWPDGAGYTSYIWRLDSGNWSTEVSVTTPIVLGNLPLGPHQVTVVGQNDAGLFQNDPILGTNAVVSLSRVWTVVALAFESVSAANGALTFHFAGVPGKTYTLEYKDKLQDREWFILSDATTDALTGFGTATDPAPTAAARFYRLSWGTGP
jgi:hypothetical protein